MGDDLIREGVINLLGLQTESKMFANRGQLKVGKRILPVWQLMINVNSAKNLATHAKGLVIAGSPEWVRFFEDFYEAAIQHSLPIYMVGIGMRATNPEIALLKKAKHLIKGVTVRDRHAAHSMKTLGIPFEWFPDPAFNANYMIPKSKRYGLVVNYRSEGGNGVFNSGFDSFWERIARNYSNIDLVTVHEMGEYEKAKKIFNAPVFYSSDYLDYKLIYASTELYIGGRIHGAVPVVACGGTAHLFYNSDKADCLQQVAAFMDTLTVSRYSPISDIEKKSPAPSLERLMSYTDKHRAYWGERL